MSEDTRRTLKDALTEALQAALHCLRHKGLKTELQATINSALADLYGRRTVEEHLPELRLIVSDARITLDTVEGAGGATTLLDEALNAFDLATYPPGSYEAEQALLGAGLRRAPSVQDDRQAIPIREGDVKPSHETEREQVRIGAPGASQDKRTYSGAKFDVSVESFAQGAEATPPTRREIGDRLIDELEGALPVGGFPSRTLSADEIRERLTSLRKLMQEVTGELVNTTEDAGRRKASLEQVLTYAHRRLSTYPTPDGVVHLQFILRLAAGLTTLQSPPTGAEVGAALYAATELAHRTEGAENSLEPEREEIKLQASAPAVQGEPEEREILRGNLRAVSRRVSEILHAYNSLSGRKQREDGADVLREGALELFGYLATVTDGLVDTPSMIDHIPGSVLEELQDDIEGLGSTETASAEWVSDNLERVRILRGCFEVLSKPPTPSKTGLVEEEGRDYLADALDFLAMVCPLLEMIAGHKDSLPPERLAQEASVLLGTIRPFIEGLDKPLPGTGTLYAALVTLRQYIDGAGGSTGQYKAEAALYTVADTLERIRKYCVAREGDYEGRRGTMISVVAFFSYLEDIIALAVGDSSRAIATDRVNVARPPFDFEDSGANIRGMGEEIKGERKRAMVDALNADKIPGVVVAKKLLGTIEDFIRAPYPASPSAAMQAVEHLRTFIDAVPEWLQQARIEEQDGAPDVRRLIDDKLREWLDMPDDTQREARYRLSALDKVFRDLLPDDEEDVKDLEAARQAFYWLRTYFELPGGAPTVKVPPALYKRIRERAERAITEHLAEPFKNGAKDRLCSALRDVSYMLKEAGEGKPREIRYEITEGTNSLLTISAIEAIDTLYGALWSCEAERNITFSLNLLRRVREVVFNLDRIAGERDKLDGELRDYNARQVLANQIHAKRDEEQRGTIAALREDNTLLSRECELQAQSIIAYMFVVNRLRGMTKAGVDCQGAYIKAIRQLKTGEILNARPEWVKMDRAGRAEKLLEEIESIAESAKAMGEGELELLARALPSVSFKTREGLTEE